jgi:hypothetical protein
MAWTEITRRHCKREGLRCESDTARATDMRSVMNAILYVASTAPRDQA